MNVKLFLYYFFILLGVVISYFEGIYVARKNSIGEGVIKSCIVLSIISGLAGAVLMAVIENYIMSFFSATYHFSRMRIPGGLLFTPILLLIPTKAMGVDIKRLLDSIAPGMFLILGFSKIGCAIYGCCYGIACSFGVTTPFESFKVFPVQLSESILCFVLFAFFFVFSVKKHRTGSAFPLSLILYGTVRFFIQFLRYNDFQTKEYFILDFWQIISIIMIICGAVWQYINSKELCDL